MMKTLFRASLALLLIAGPALAVTPVTVTQTSQADFAAGEAKNVVIWSLGEMTLGRATQTLLKSHPDVEAISALAVTEAGETIVGTATRGLVLRIARDGTVSELADLKAVVVTGLVVDGPVVYASTAGGKAGVYRIDTRGEKPTFKRIWSDEQAASIWAIARLGSTLFVATAPHGKVFAIEPDGSAEVVFTAKQAVLRSITASGKALLVGTGEDGLVYRLEKTGGKWTSRVLLDAEENEIVALAVDADGAVYAAATNAGPSTPTAPSESDVGYPGGPGHPERPATKSSSAPATRPATKPASQPEAESAGPIQPGTYIVRAGDTLTSVAARAYGDASYASLIRRANPTLRPGALKVGQSLTIPPHKLAEMSTAASAAASAPAASAPAAASAAAEEGPESGTVLAPASEEPPAENHAEDHGMVKSAPHAAAPGGVGPATRPSETAARRGARPRGGAAKGNTVYRIDPDGIVKVVARQSQTITNLVLADGKLYLSTSGEEGAIQEVNLDSGAWGTLAKVEPHQVTVLAVGREGALLAGTADAASLIRFDSGLAPSGTFISSVMDGEQVARWSSLDVQADRPDGTNVTIATRTGNVAEPVEGTWSDWSQEIHADQPWAKIQSPAGRFCQYRLTLTRAKGSGRDATPVVDAVQVVYQIANLPPEIESVTADAVDRTKVPQAAKEAGPLRYRQVKIKATDADKDELRYTIYYRQRGSEVWIKAESNLDKPLWVWDTQTVPDGVYEIKVEANDEASNSPATAQKHSWISRPVIVDNTPPVITDLSARPQGRTIHLSVAATDSNRILGMQYVLDSAEEPVVMDAAGGVFDSPSATSQATIKDVAPGPHVITVKVHDEFGNSACQAVFVSVPADKGR